MDPGRREGERRGAPGEEPEEFGCDGAVEDALRGEEREDGDVGSLGGGVGGGGF